MFQVDHGDQDQDGQIQAEQQHVPGQSVTSGKKAKDDRRAQLHQHIAQGQWGAATGTVSLRQQIAYRRQPGSRPTRRAAVRTLGGAQAGLRWQGVGQ